MKTLFLISCLIFCLFTTNSQTTYAANSQYYAKVETAEVFLYSSQSETSSIFEIPVSYFVKVENFNNTFYKAYYNNISGYVKKDSVSLMSGIPQNPYAQATFRVFVSNYMYANPTQSSSVVCQIDTNDILTFFGKKNGEQLNSSTNTWYYSKVIKNGQDFCGYVFSGITDYLSVIPQNVESFERINEISQNENNAPTTELSSKTKILLIVSISIPSAMILYFLIKPTKIMQVTANKRQIKKDRKIRHHGDYFEFDESEL